MRPGKVVAPGFIDLHSHGALVILDEPRHEPKVRQGVTTEVVGVDGNGFAPFLRREDLEAFVHLDCGLDGRPDIGYDWGSVASYLDRYDGAVEHQHRHADRQLTAAHRCSRLGGRAGRRTRARPDARPASREAMAEGAFGLSSGLDYPPGGYATTEELGGADRRRPVGTAASTTPTSVIRWATAISTRSARRSRSAGGPVRPPTSPTSTTDRRIPVVPNRCSRSSTTLAPRGSTSPSIRIPTSGRRPDSSSSCRSGCRPAVPGPLLERLADRATRDRVRADFKARGAAYASPEGWADVRLGAFRQPENLRWEARSVADVMNETGHDALDVICDLLLAEDLGVSQVTSGPWGKTLAPFVAHPIGMVGTDSTFLGAKPSPRTYGSFPRILGQFVRDEALMTLEEAVRKMTSAPAARLGLRDRGVIRDGYVADLVVFDPPTVRSTATYDEPRSFPVGIEHVIVAGTPVVSDGVHTGATPGRALRHGRD